MTMTEAGDLKVTRGSGTVIFLAAECICNNSIRLAFLQAKGGFAGRYLALSTISVI